jgi:hypothetical protein
MMKNMAKITLFLALMAIPLIVGSCATVAERGTQSGGSPPVITHSFASKEISHGDIWKIYVEANDSDGDMRQFVCVLKQVGYGDYSSEYVMIKKRYREKMKGYLTFNSAAGGGLRLSEWTQFSMTIYIRDRGRNTSNKVVFPLVLSRGSKQGPPPSPFDVNGLERLGVISIELGGRGRGD